MSLLLDSATITFPFRPLKNAHELLINQQLKELSPSVQAVVFSRQGILYLAITPINAYL
jgi:hypothetical protein